MNAKDSQDQPRGLLHVLPELLRKAGVELVVVETLRKQASFRGGDFSTAAKEVTRRARTEHRERGFGFWEFALAQTPHIDTDTRDILVRGALKHDTQAPQSREEQSIEEFEAHLQSGRWTGLPARSMTVLCSTVRTRGGSWLHLPMLDFGVPVRVPGSEDAALAALKAMDLRGALLSSGTSYHFIGSELATTEEMLTLLARAQLLSPIVDYRWVSHQLIDRTCRLRISTDEERNLQPHTLVCVI